jgi:hypothetical protein
MLENYDIDDCGVIYQKKITEINYNKTYVESRYGKASTAPTLEMSYMRFGFLVQALGYLPNSIMDVGFGNGDFLKVANNANVKCYGYDVHHDIELPAGVTRVNDILAADVEVTTFFDSLEHMRNPYSIENIKTDYILISVPSCNNPTDDEWFKGWKHRRENEHLWHFNAESLKNFASKIGFSILEYSTFEDVIRKSVDYSPNIQTVLMKRQ